MEKYQLQLLQKHNLSVAHVSILARVNRGEMPDGRTMKLLVKRGYADRLEPLAWKITESGLKLLKGYYGSEQTEHPYTNRIVLLTVEHLLEQLTEQEVKLSKALAETRHMREALNNDYQI